MVSATGLPASQPRATSTYARLNSMTASGGDSGEKPQNEGEHGVPGGAYEAPPIEAGQAPSGFEAPPSPPAYTGYEAPGGYPPPSYPPPSYPPPSYPPQPGYPPPAGPPPGDYTQPGYPPPPPPPQQFGAPPYPGAGYGYPAPASGTNTLAIGSLVASVVGLLCGIGSIIGIVLGVVALNQIKQTRQGGYGLAVAGIVVGVASLVISLIWMIYAIN